MSDSAHDAPSYWEQIERYFTEKRGSALILSPKDWPLVSSWEEQHIPLEVIYAGIDSAFIRFEEKHAAAQRRPIQTLSYCKYDVEKSWKTWQEEHPESLESGEEQQLPHERRKLITKLRSALIQLQRYAESTHYARIQTELHAAHDSLTESISQIEQASDESTLAAITAHIRELEHQLAARFEETLDEQTRQALYAEAEVRLASHKSQMKTHAYEETLQLVFRQELRKMYPLPSFL